MIHSGSIGPLDFLTGQYHDLLPARTRMILRDSLQVSFTRLNLGNNNISFAKCSLPDKTVTPFRRIDGNHRLDAMELIQDKKAAYVVPFCIILLTNDYYGSGKDDDNKTARTEMEIFHHINSKARPLTPLEQYRGLFNLFSAHELEQYGKEFGVAKSYLEKHGALHFTNIATFLEEKEDIILYSIKFLLDRGITMSEDDLADVFSKLEHTYFDDNESIRNCRSRFAIVPYVYYCFEGSKQKMQS